MAIRGDLQVNEAKLRSLLQAPDLRLAADQELEAAGLVAGYASPVGLSNVTVVVDDSVESATNLVAGANEPGFHLTNVNYPRDFQADLRGDIAQVRSGDRSIEDDEPLELMTGIEIGNTFKLGTFYSDKLDAQYLAADGRRHPFVMGSYGIGIGRLAASVVERYHDADGIIWPVSVAPYDVHIVQLGAGDVAADAERLAEELEAAGLSVVLDDRGDSAGVKFNDADLIGLPLPPHGQPPHPGRVSRRVQTPSRHRAPVHPPRPDRQHRPRRPRRRDRGLDPRRSRDHAPTRSRGSSSLGRLPQHSGPAATER